MSEFVLKSNVPLPELPRAVGGEIGANFQLLPAQDVEPVPLQWFHHWQQPDGEIWLSFAKQGTKYLLRFPDLADFLISADGKNIKCRPSPDTPAETIRHLLLDQVIPLVLNKRGGIVLHASAVATPKGGIAFLGATGQGKSTLAASFSMRGFPLMTDDCLLLKEDEGELWGIPSYPGVRLWPGVVPYLFEEEPTQSAVAHYTSKRRMVNGQLQFGAGALPLIRVYVLEPPLDSDMTTNISITPIPRRDAFIELFKYSFKLDITDKDKLKKEFQSLSRIVAKPLFFRLSYSHDFSLLPSVQKAIIKNLTEG